MFKRTQYQFGWLRKKSRKRGPDVWVWVIGQLRQLRISRYGVTPKAQQLERFRLPRRNLSDRVICSVGASFRTALSLFSFKTGYLSLEEAKLSPRLSLAAATT